MALVKFVHSVRYNRVIYPAHTPFEADNKDIALLQEQGAILLSALGEELDSPTSVTVDVSSDIDIENSEDKIVEPEEDLGETKQALISYTVSELIEFAKDHNIDIKGKTKKADIYNIIVTSL